MKVVIKFVCSVRLCVTAFSLSLDLSTVLLVCVNAFTLNMEKYFKLHGIFRQIAGL